MWTTNVKYKAIRSAAHNFGHSFVSATNGACMSELAQIAVSSGLSELHIDLWTGTVRPDAFATPAVIQAMASAVDRLPKQFAAEGVDVRHVVSATMVIRFKLRGTVAASGRKPPWTVPFECAVTVEDDRGKTHEGRVDDMWHVGGGF